MSHGSLSRRAVLATCFSVALLATLTTCSTVPLDRGAAPAKYEIAPLGNGLDCGSSIGSKDRNHPFICVDPSTFTKDPADTLIINDVQGRKGGKKSTSPVKIWWQTIGGSGDLQVVFPTGNTCVTDVRCNPGQCSGSALPQDPANPAGSTCTYSITLDGHTVDPTVVVEPCCGG